MKKLSISKGNVKVDFHSVSLHPELTCDPNMPCWVDCYARGMEWRKSVSDAWLNNFELLNEDPQAFWDQVRVDAMLQRYYRYFVGGDFPKKGGYQFLCDMVETAKKCPGTTFWVYTKKYWIVNLYCDKNGGRSAIPENLKMHFSEWENYKIKNPYNFPTTKVFDSEDQIPSDYFKCTNECATCAVNGVGCMNSKDGDKVAFVKHGHGRKAENLAVDREEILSRYNARA